MGQLDRTPRSTLVLVALSLALSILSFPLDSQSLLDETASLTQRGESMTILYSLVQGRPMERSVSFPARQQEMIDRVVNWHRAALQTGLGPVRRLWMLIRMLDAEARELYLSRSESDWVPAEASHVPYQQFIDKEVPFAWCLQVLGLSHVHIALVLHLLSWLGMACVCLLFRQLVASACLSFTIPWAIVLLGFPLGPVTSNLALSALSPGVPVLIGFLLLQRPGSAARARVSTFIGHGALLASLAGYSILALFLSPATHRLDATLVVAAVSWIALTDRNRAALLRAMTAGLLLWLVQLPFDHYAREAYGPLTRLNHAKNEAFVPINLFQGNYERPGPFGLPNGDFAYTVAETADLYLWISGRQFQDLHALRYWGESLYFDWLTHYPLHYIETLWKRVYVVIFHHRSLSFDLYQYRAGVPLFVGGCVLLLLLLLLAASNPRTPWSRPLPLLAFLAGHLFGFPMALTVVHTHVGYLRFAAFLLFLFLPALVWFAIKHASKPGVALHLARRRLVLILVGVIGLVLGPYLFREIRKENHAFRTWFQIHAGTREVDVVPTPESLREEVEAIRRIGHEFAGSIDMYGAWALHAFVERATTYDTLLSAHGLAADRVASVAKAEGMALAYYRKAIEAAPDNAFYASYAFYFEPRWGQLTKESLERWPRHPYAAYMAWNLALRQQDPEQRSKYSRLAEEAMHESLERSGKYRPGFSAIPDFEVPPRVPAQIADRGLLVRLAPREEVRLAPSRLHGASRVDVGYSLETLTGEIIEELAVDGKVRPLQAVPRPGLPHYRGYSVDDAVPTGRLAQVRLRATDRGASLVIRDYYILWFNPRLLER